MIRKLYFLLLSFFILIQNSQAQTGADSLFNFISQNRAKSAVYLVQNDSVLAMLNPNKRMPLASTVKLLVAVEFAKQSAAGVISESTPVALDDLEKYHFPLTDGGAHAQWLIYEKEMGHIQNDSIALLHVAQGMMWFSSNANTEYIMDLLGLDNVKNNLQLLGMHEHTPIYYLVSSLFMYQNPKKKKETAILKGIKRLNEEQYARYIYDMHNALKYDTVLKAKFNPADLSANMQKLWSERLPSSNVKTYAKLCNILNNRKYFTAEAYASFARVVEFALMANPANQKMFKHAGMKGGSTAWVLTKALYATTQEGDRIELCYFFNDLTPKEQASLESWMNDFELRVLTDENFRTQFAKKL